MEGILNLIINAENVRTLAMLVSIFSCFVWLKTSITSVHRRIDGVEASVKELKYNDFAHLNNTIEALTYALEKNESFYIYPHGRKQST